MEFSKLDTCKFIADHAAELAKLAESAKLPTLSFIASMMRLQAEADAIELANMQRAA